MRIDISVGRLSRLAAGFVLAVSMAPLGIGGAIAAPGDMPSADGCYATIQHDGQANPAYCGVSHVVTPSTLGVGVPSSAAGAACTNTSMLAKPAARQELVASLDDSIGMHGDVRQPSATLTADRGCCYDGELSAPAFSTFETASLAVGIVIPKSALLPPPELVVACDCSCH